MTDDERDERKQVEADREEDLELDEEQSGEVRGGTGGKYPDVVLKRGIDSP